MFKRHHLLFCKLIQTVFEHICRSLLNLRNRYSRINHLFYHGWRNQPRPDDKSSPKKNPTSKFYPTGNRFSMTQGNFTGFQTARCLLHLQRYLALHIRLNIKRQLREVFRNRLSFRDFVPYNRFRPILCTLHTCYIPYKSSSCSSSSSESSSPSAPSLASFARNVVFPCFSSRESRCGNLPFTASRSSSTGKPFTPNFDCA